MKKQKYYSHEVYNSSELKKEQGESGVKTTVSFQRNLLGFAADRRIRWLVEPPRAGNSLIERIAHFLRKNERMSDLLKKFTKKNWQKYLNSYFLVCFIYVFLFKK